MPTCKALRIGKRRSYWNHRRRGVPVTQRTMAWLYAMGTSPARYVVERHHWAEAAVLVVPANTFPGGRWAWTEANLHFARALGLSHTGKTEAARTEVQKLASLRDILAGINDKYWADQVEIQRESAEAWITLAEGKSEQALRQMRSAAEHEDKTDKHGVTPGVHPTCSRDARRYVAGHETAQRSAGRVRKHVAHSPKSLQLVVRCSTRRQALRR